MKKRFVSIDNLKGILTLLVIFGHVTVGLGGLAHGIYSMATSVQKISTVIYAVHMPLFFAVSGFFWKEKGKISIKDRALIIKNKTIAIALPYLLCSVAYFFVKYAVSSFTVADVTWNSLIEIPIRPIEFFWYLYSLYTITILAELLDALGVKKQIVLIIWAIVALNNFVYTDFMSLYKTAENAVYFYVGSVAFDYKEQLSKWKMIGVTGVCTLVFFWRYLNIYEAYHIGTHFLLCVSIIGLIIGLSLRFLEKELKYVTYIGNNSMPFYIIHVIFVGGIRIILYRMGIADVMTQVLVGFVGSTIITYVLYRFILSKVKCIDFMFYPAKYLNK